MKKIFILSIAMALMMPAFSQEKAGKKDTTTHLTIYSYLCPDHSNFIADKPGKCPKCGMELKHLSAKEQMKRNVTKTYNCPVDVEVISTQPGKCPHCAKYMKLSHKEKMKATAVKLYACPMHPDKTSKMAGKCTSCGMDLTEVK